MLMVPSHLLHLCRYMLQEDSLYPFPTEQREADEPAVPCIALLTFSEDWYTSLSPRIGALPQSPWSFKDDRKQLCMDTNKLPQQLLMQPIFSHWLAWVKFSQVIPDSCLVPWWCSLSFLNPFNKHRGLWGLISEDWITGGTSTSGLLVPLCH